MSPGVELIGVAWTYAAISACCPTASIRGICRPALKVQILSHVCGYFLYRFLRGIACVNVFCCPAGRSGEHDCRSTEELDIGVYALRGKPAREFGKELLYGLKRKFAAHAGARVLSRR